MLVWGKPVAAIQCPSSRRSPCYDCCAMLLRQGLFCCRDPPAQRRLPLDDLEGCAVVEFLARAAVAQRFVRGFKNLGHSQSRPPVALGTRAGQDGVDEVHEIDLEWLATWHGRNCHATVVVAQLDIG